MSMSTYLSHKLLDHTLRNTTYTSPATVYLALFEVMVDADNAGGTEVTGGSYARQSVSFGAPASRVCYNDAPLTFPTMPATTIVGAGLYDALTVGNLLHFGVFSNPRLVGATSDFVVSVGDVVAVLR